MKFTFIDNKNKIKEIKIFIVYFNCTEITHEVNVSKSTVKNARIKQRGFDNILFT